MAEECYFVGQTNLRIQLDLEVDCTGATVLIKYKKPNGESDQFSAIVDVEDPTKIYYDVANATDLDLFGDWIFWAHITFADSTIGMGCAKEQEVLQEGALPDESDPCNL